MFTIQAVWDDSVAFMRRERALLMPLALATLGLANMMIELVQDTSSGGSPSPTDMALSLLIVPAFLWLLVGQLAIVTLALRPSCSVGEALRHSVTRLGINLLIALLLGIVLTVLFLPPMVALAPYTQQLAARDYTHVHLPLWASLWCVGLLALLVFTSTRLFVLAAVTIERRGNPIELIRQSFALTRGVFGKLLLFTIGLAVFLLLLQAALAASFGLVAAVLGKLISSPLTGKLLESIAQSVLAAAFGCIQAVFAAKAYQRLSGAQSAGAIFK